MGNTPSTRLSTISSTFSKHKTTEKTDKTDFEHSQSTTAVQFQKDLLAHQKEEEEYEYLTKLTTFDAHTLRLLKRRFDTIDQTIQKDGVISIEEFAKVLEMDCTSILLRRFFKFMDKSSMGSLNFRNFATALSLLSIEAPDEDKIKLSFFLYDINDDKQIDRIECTKMVRLALNEIDMKLSENQIQVIVNNTFNEADLNNDGFIDYNEYKIYCKKNPRVLQPFKIDIATLVLDANMRDRKTKISNKNIKSLRHWPSQNHNQNKHNVIRKIKKSVPTYMKREKIERVRSIHNAQQIMGMSIDDMDQKNNNYNNKKLSVSLECSNTDSTSEESLPDHNNNNNNNNSTPNQATQLKFALSADSGDRRRKKKEKYSKKKNKQKKMKKMKKMKKNKHKNKNKNKNQQQSQQQPQQQPQQQSFGLNTSVPRTPPKSKQKTKIKQSDLDAIERLLN